MRWASGWVMALWVCWLVLPLAAVPGAQAQSAITIVDRGVTIEFPERLTFAAEVTSSAVIDRVTLEYGVEKQTCGVVTAIAFPTFTPGPQTTVTWVWEMRKSGAEPPGTTIWYRWRVHDAAGNETVSDRLQTLWLDKTHHWSTLQRDTLIIHWYNESETFANTLLQAGTTALTQLAETTGMHLQKPVDLYIYASSTDLHDATLYEPGWTGGEAFPEHGIVIMGVSSEQLEWGKGTVAHELTHIVVGQLTFSCLSSVPTWLNEGIAVYGQGGPEAESLDQLHAAVRANALLSVRALNGGFSEHPSKADLSYSESFSLVNYLITQYGPGQLRGLFDDLRQGLTPDAALLDVYGFGLDGLEDRWRTSVDAPPRQTTTTPDATVVPTTVPTYEPISAAPVAPILAPGETLAEGATPLPGDASSAAVTPTPGSVAASPVTGGIPLVPLLVAGGTAVLIMGVAVVLFLLQRRRTA
jgi:hypothetical protein